MISIDRKGKIGIVNSAVCDTQKSAQARIISSKNFFHIMATTSSIPNQTHAAGYVVCHSVDLHYCCCHGNANSAKTYITI